MYIIFLQSHITVLYKRKDSNHTTYDLALISDIIIDISFLELF